MKYYSTRDTERTAGISSAEAIKTGLAGDGGLFMPETIPAVSGDFIRALAAEPYDVRAAKVLSLFLDDYNYDDLLADCREAYSEARFPGGAAPLCHVADNMYTLELWHGPTCAFKDMALQIMPRLLSRALKMTGETRRAHILVATSGDTGKAALEGYRDVEGIDISVFYPVDGVSAMQKRQMTTQEGENVNVCAVRGNFDDAQNGVKAIFSNISLAAKAEEKGFFFSSANSINWGRLAPQIVYYFSAYCDLMDKGVIALGDKVNFCVPTGNFGNIFAAYIAREMGLPVKNLICASNSNCVLTDFIRTGVYDRTRQFYKTMSPSMDILISSNLERLLYLLGGAELTAQCMEQLKAEGKYTAPETLMTKLREVFSGYCCSEEGTAATIKAVFSDNGYLADPHTAVAIGSAKQYIADSGDSTVLVVDSTASPYKFSADVCRSLGVNAEGSDGEIIASLEKATGTVAPVSLTATLTKEIRFTGVVDKEQMAAVVFGEI